MSSAKRTASVPAASNSSNAVDILNDPRVLRHELRHVKIRLRESLATTDELSQLNAEQQKEIQQQRVYCKRIEEQWTAMEEGMRAMAAALQLPPIPPAEPATSTAAIPAAAASSSSASVPSFSGAAALLSGASNPVLRMLSARWSALTGQTFVPGGKNHLSSSSTAGDAMTDEGAATDGIEAEDEEDDDEDEEAAAARKGSAHASKLVALDEALQNNLQQRAAFAQALLAQLVQQLPNADVPSAAPAAATVAPDDPAAQLVALQADRLSLRQRLHASENEVSLLTATLAERDARVEKEREANKALLRRVERMQVDQESGVNAAAAKTGAADAAGSASAPSASPAGGGGTAGASNVGADMAMLDAQAPDTRPLSPTSLARLSTVTPSAAASFAGKWGDKDVLLLKESLVEERKLAKRRLEELLQVRSEKAALELARSKDKMDALHDESAVVKARPYVLLQAQAKAIMAERDRLRGQVEVLQAEQEQMQLQLGSLKTEFSAQQTVFEQRMRDAGRDAEQSLSALAEQLQAAQASNMELQQSLPRHPDYAYYTHLREHVLPALDAAVKALQADAERTKEEKRITAEVATAAAGGADAAAAATAASAAVPPVSDEALLKQVGRVLRLWKEQERKLVAEKAALAEELDALRKSSSAAGATSALSSLSSSSSAELAQMRLACSAAQKELAAVTAELRALQTSAGPSSTDIADLQEQLENQKALASSLGEELNSVSEAAEAAQQRLVHLGSVATFEGTKVLDKLRAERVQNQRQLAAMRTEQTGLRATNERLEQTLAAQNRALASLRQEADNLTARTSSAREIEGALQSSVDKLRSAAAQAASEALDARTKMQQISERHDACGGIMAAMEKKQQEAIAAAQKYHEGEKLLRARIVKLQDASGSSSSSRRSGADESPDAARIRQLQLRLTCKVCETRPKDAVIAKCMHAFCGECLQKNLDTRLRKCPTCGLKFDKSDVRQLYL